MEVVHVWLFSKLRLQFRHDPGIFFLEHLCEFALACAFRSIGAVVLYVVNEEEAEDLDAFEVESTLTLEVSADCFPYLDAAFFFFLTQGHTLDDGLL